MTQTYYKIYCTEGRGREFVGRIEAENGRWHVRLISGLRYYVPNFSGSLADCGDYCKREFSCELIRCEREIPLPLMTETDVAAYLAALSNANNGAPRMARGGKKQS